MIPKFCTNTSIEAINLHAASISFSYDNNIIETIAFDLTHLKHIADNIYKLLEDVKND